MRSISSRQRSRILQLEEAARPLEPDAGERDRLMAEVHAYAQGFLDGLPERLAYQHDKSSVARIRELEIGSGTRSIDQLVDRIDESVVGAGLVPSHGGHLGYIPGGGIYASSLADYLAAVTNEYAGVRFAGPGAVEMEDAVLDWMAALVGFPEGSDGNLASGGSVASLIAVVTAREATGLRARDYERAVVYSTAHVHQCLHKALRVAGLGETVRRDVPLDDGFRMCPDSLAALIATDRAQGLRPWLVLASAGTADTGAVDPLSRIADVCEREDLWYHVDGAYGGFFALVEGCQPVLAGMERADSLVLDPHKGLFLPYGTGAVLVRHGEALQDSHTYYASYLQDTVVSEWGGRSPAAVSPELTKHFRGLRVWLPLLLHGEEPFRACLEEKLELARYFRREVEALGFETGPEPDLSVVTYRWVPETGDANAFNRALVEETHRDGRVFLSSTTVDGTFLLRMAALAFRTHLHTIDLALDVLREAVERLEADPARWRAAARGEALTAGLPGGSGD
ncbi:pyridoxal phosphate-dependent decarboxylase family protein [Candidatus Palauibacter sp.]|uniref:pyridoxal phosphate-dependent decarboxylase family protein n=1 Tax=Candidatus Palauibacter sp. TaxID=3101350 RepID=UPI003B52E150